MTMQLPNLDDRSFDELVREGLSILPAWAPEWTDHNPSDPGITLVELLAYFTEMLLYRIGRITPESKLQFLRLLKGAEWQGWQNLARSEAGELQRAIDDTVRELAHMDCAVTAQDFERFALEAAVAHLGSEHRAEAVRTLAIPAADLEHGRDSGADRDLQAHVSVVVAPGRELDPEATTRMLNAVRTSLVERSLLTTRVHVVGPMYLHVAIGFKLAPRMGLSTRELMVPLQEALDVRFGSDVWPFGKTVHLSEIVGLIDELPGVDYVEDVTVLQIATDADELVSPESSLGVQVGLRSTLGVDAWVGGPPNVGTGRMLRSDAGRLASIVLRPWELVRVVIADDGAVELAPDADDRTEAGGSTGTGPDPND
jgi:hypothetical protein